MKFLFFDSFSDILITYIYTQRGLTELMRIFTYL